MKVLLCNDDGVHAEGLWAIHDRLAASHTVVVVAPDRERTAASHAITLHVPIRINEMTLNGRGKAYAVSGTPADCIKLALTEILAERPDLVISGINPGANIGIDINYSGTFAAAREAAFYGVTALAVSIAGKAPRYYNEVADFMADFAESILKKELPKGTLLNINFPDRPMNQVQGIRVSRQYIGLLSESIERRLDPRNRVYYWYGTHAQIEDGDPDLDAVALMQNYVSITPIQCDMTDYGMFDALQEWNSPIK